MPATYEPIATTTLGSAAASITFSSISSAYTDLICVVTLRTTTGNGCTFRFNSDSGNNYSSTFLRGDGTTAESNRYSTWSNLPVIGVYGLSSTQPSLYRISIFNYAGSTNKTILSEGSTDRNGSGNVDRAVGLWRNTNAITSITIADGGSSTITAGSTATLYGILKA